MFGKGSLANGAIVVVFLTTAFTPLTFAQTPTLLHYFKFDSGYSSEVSSLVGNPLLSGTSINPFVGVTGGSAYFNGVDSLLLLEGRDVLPAGAFTFAFWEKADPLLGEEIPQGYFVCDAASNPLQNLYLRRYANPVSGGGEVSAVNGMIATNHFSQFAPEDISTEVWHQHTISYDASGMGYWWVDGQLKTLMPTGSPFTGLAEVDPESEYNYEGLVLGNRLTQDRTYLGHMDEWQIYQGIANGGMAQYLYDNPGATLATYDAGAYPDPGVPDAPGIRPADATVHRWKFDGNLNENGGAFHGTAIGDAAAGADNGAYAGSGAVAFDGDNDGVLISKDVIATNKYSIALWSKDASGAVGYLFGDSDATTSTYSNLLLRRYNSTQNGEYSIWAGGDDFPNFVDPTTEAPVTYDEWHHLVLAIDGEWGNVRAYVDGVLAMTQNIEADWGAGDGFQALMSGLYLGNRADLARDYAGLIDDLQIYNWNLSEEDAAYLFNNPGETLIDTRIAGDANGDEKVDAADVSIMAANWGAADATWSMGDFNNDGTINKDDAKLLAQNWGTGVGGGEEASTVPEPGSLALLFCISLGFLMRRRRQLIHC